MNRKLPTQKSSFLPLMTSWTILLVLLSERSAAAFQQQGVGGGPTSIQLGTRRTKSFQNGNTWYHSAASSSSPSSSPRTKLQVLNSEKQDNSDSLSFETDEDLKREIKNEGLLRLAELSLQDYQWRSSKFKTDEADRQVEESLARMMGEEAAYVRPMDASEEKIGPLGLLEKSSVDWLRNVIEEEARRAKSIVRMGGMMVRPIDAATEDGELGPLGLIEQQFVSFLDTIRRSEKERSRTKTLRPKDLDPSTRGPLGEAELKAVESIREILNSERLRAEQSKLQDQVVRPIDVPGPIGEFEMAVLEVIEAEQQRKVDREESGALLVRPKDASMKGPLGEFEEQAVAAVKRLTEEEKRRLQNIQRVLDENRPMEQDQLSILGIIESITVGIIRAPVLLVQIVKRVNDLMRSEPLADADAEVLKRYRKIEKARRNMKKKK